MNQKMKRRYWNPIYKLYNLLFVVLLQMVAAVEEPMPGHYPFLLDQTLEAVQTPAVRITHQLHQTGSHTTQIPILFLCTHTNRIKKIINYFTYDLQDISFEILDLSITDNRTIKGIVQPQRKSAENHFFFKMCYLFIWVGMNYSFKGICQVINLCAAFVACWLSQKIIFISLHLWWYKQSNKYNIIYYIKSGILI